MEKMNVTTAREALMAELLQDTDRLVARLDAIDTQLAQRIDSAVRSAAGQAFLASKMNFESMIYEQTKLLTNATHTAAGLIELRFSSGVTQLVAATEALERKTLRVLLILISSALLAGVVGGIMGASLARAVI